MIVVADASSLIALWQIDLLYLVPLVLGEAHVPIAVWDEFLIGRTESERNSLTRLVWVNIANVRDRTRVEELMVELDPGESEAIALAQEIEADTLLIDERKGRAVAMRVGLNTMGVAGMLVVAKREGHILRVEPHLSRLRNEFGFRLSNSLYREVLRRAGEI